MTSTTTVLGLLPLTGALNFLPAAKTVFGVGEGLEKRSENFADETSASSLMITPWCSS